MKRLLLIPLALLFFSCDNPSESVVGCENGAEYSESGYYCDDWQFVEDLYNCNGDECTAYLFDFGTGEGSFPIDWYNGRIINISYAGIPDAQFDIIPESIGNLTYLQYIDMEYVGLISIPNNICNLPNIQNIDVSDNNLCEEYNFSCIDDWGTQSQSNCCEGPEGQPNWTTCP